MKKSKDKKKALSQTAIKVKLENVDVWLNRNENQLASLYCAKEAK